MSADDKAAAAWNDYVSQQQEEKIEELERQLNAANQRIKRLEEAGDALYELCDPSPIQFDLVDQIPQRLKAWEEAKEAKP